MQNYTAKFVQSCRSMLRVNMGFLRGTGSWYYETPYAEAMSYGFPGDGEYLSICLRFPSHLSCAFCTRFGRPQPKAIQAGRPQSSSSELRSDDINGLMKA